MSSSTLIARNVDADLRWGAGCDLAIVVFVHRSAVFKLMPRAEKIIVGIAGLLFVLAAVLEGLSRLGEQPAYHDVAAWVLMAALFAVLTPIALAAGVVACQTFVARKKDRDSDAA
jgi:hypothetical protein